MRYKIALYISVVVLILTGTSSVHAVQFGTDPSSTPSEKDRAISMENADLVASLKPADQCLFARSVFPAGGVGYEDSSLPYDGFPEIDRAYLTLRALVIRNNMDSVLSVQAQGILGQTGEEPSVVILASGGAVTASPPKVSDFARQDVRIENSIASLKSAGIPVRVEVRDVPSTAKLCQVRKELHELKGSNGKLLPMFSQVDADAGRLILSVEQENLDAVSDVVRRYDPLVVVTTVTDISTAGRSDDYPPWFGGGRIYFNSGPINHDCSASFRVNNIGLISADHCVGSSFQNGGNWVGNRMYGLSSAYVDAMVVAGSSYSNNVWIGGVNTSSRLPAYGIYPYYTLGSGNQLLVSGATSGQIGVSYVGLENGSGCMNLDTGAYVCQLLETHAAGSQCIGGDSGGPVAVYDPANGRLIPLGIVTATTGTRTLPHSCVVTNMMAISYLYGNSSIG